MNTLARLHLSALRDCRAHILYRAVRGTRRDLDCETFMRGALSVVAESFTDAGDFSRAVECIAKRGWREVQTQLHILETQEREINTACGKSADMI